MTSFFKKREQPRRTAILWILCVCAMMDAFTNGLSNLVFIAMPDVIAQSMEAVKSMPMFSTPEYEHALDAVMSIKGWQHGLLLLTEIASFAGAFLMLVKLNPIGFHTYTIGQICQIMVMNLVIGGGAKVGLSAMMTTALIVAIFATQLRFMHHGDDDSATDDPEEFDEEFEDEEDSDTEV